MNKQPKTIFITSSPQITSATTFFLKLANQFSKKGYRVVVIFDKEKVSDYKCLDEVIYEKWPNKRPTKLKDFIFLKKLIKKYKPQYIISTFGAVNVSIICGFLFGVSNRIAWNRTKFSQLLKDSKNPLKTKIMQFRKSLILNFFATEIHTNSEDTLLDTNKYLKIPRKKIKVINFLLENKNIEVDEKQKIVSFVGRFSPSKGQEILIKAIPLISKNFPDYKFKFIGDGEKKEACIELAKDLNIYDKCIFTGSVSQQEVYKYLAASKLHVSASADEAFGMVNLEAITLETPILAHKVGGIPEILKDAVNGYFFNINDSVDLSNKIQKILSDEELYKKLQIGCKDVFENNFEMSELNLNKRIGLILKKK